MNEWWHGAIVYQIYPRSFKDSTESGIGDLRGIVEKFDYLISLGVDAIWISPFFKSPMIDYGYDISDYRAIDPMFGDMHDFDELINLAKQHHVKVVLDLAINHTSSHHLWFLESRHDKTNPKADWYVWADPQDDGSPPNNWLSLFGGSAWQWESRRGQYYLHNFFSTQPDLNLRNPEVQDAIIEECRFWLDKGIDGFRLDACNFYIHDEKLRNNPARPKDMPGIKGIHDHNPYSMQLHQFDKSQPENISFLKRLRKMADSYHHKPVLFAEILDDNNLTMMADYIHNTGPLHSAYSFQCIGDRFNKDVLDQCLRHWHEDQWPTWTFGNHDVARLASRWLPEFGGDDFVKQIYCFMSCVKGSIFIYQGDELALPQAEIPFDKLRDPYGIEFFPDFKGRDGCRTPMPWTESFPTADFTAELSESWLPIPSEHIMRAVSVQTFQPSSVLNYVKECLKLRHTYPVFRYGEMILDESNQELISFYRQLGSEHFLCLFNLTPDKQTYNLEKFEQFQILDISKFYQQNKKEVEIYPRGSVVIDLSS